MTFVPKETKKKVKATYKTLYLPADMAEKINEIAAKNQTSFNNVVVSMIEKCLNDD